MSSDFPASSKLRILIFNWRDLAHPLAGGAEVYTHRVAEEWIKMGHEVTLFCSSVIGKPELENLNGLKIVRRGGKHSVYRKAKKFYKQEGRGNFDLIIDEVNTRPFGAPKWANDALVVALIHQVCREIWFYQVSFPIAFIGRYILEPFWLSSYRNVATITVSQSSKESLELYGLNKVYVIPEGFSQKNFKREVEKSTFPTIIFIGRLTSNKRPEDAIKAFVLLKRKLPSVVLKVIGSGPEERSIRRDLPDGVELLGSINDKEKLKILASAHLLLVTSVREGWGLVVTEAAMVGTRSIGYNVPGLRDSITASNGILCEDNEVALSEALYLELTRDHETNDNDPVAGGVIPWSKVSEEILGLSVRALGLKV